MKKNIVVIMLLLIISQSSCKKFLEVESLHKISGNVFWKQKSDAESFTMDLYAKLRDKYTSTSFMQASGDLRSGFIKTASSSTEYYRRSVYDLLARNDLKAVFNTRQYSAPNTDIAGGMNLQSLTLWADFYKVIQGANMLIDQVDKGIPGVSDNDSKKYKAEGAFLRCLSYFILVRLYGDVVYYTEPYVKDPMPRENQVAVINKCIADLMAHKDNLPLDYPDPAFRAVRATKGAALDLLMNMNMWNAGFDKENNGKYYRQTADLGKALIDLNVYKLIPVENFREVTRGRSQEGIFELFQSINYDGPANSLAFFGEMMLKSPNKGPAALDNSSSHAYYKASYLNKLYSGGTDKRKDLWFNPVTMLAQNGTFELLKYVGEINVSTGLPEWSLILFRYSEALLLRAEALAELGENEEAIAMLNMVRQKAGAELYSGSGGQVLKDAIFIERGKELMGEGHLYFDLIRTGRITSSQWTDNPLTQDQFDRGGWTWPIDVNATLTNPFMTLNSYWQ